MVQMEAASPNQAAGVEADHAGQTASPSDPFTDALRRPDLFEALASFPDVKAHMADPGFTGEIERLRALANSPNLDTSDIIKTAEIGQKIARACHHDPRIMQALMSLQGQKLIVDEKDLKRAEDMGDMKRREPVQLEQLQMVHGLTDPDHAKAKGNEHFSKGDVPAALAHYEKAIELLKGKDQVPATTLATLLSNAALCLLKLKWPDRAKQKVSMAIAAVRQVDDPSFDQSKLFYRRALACEQLREFPMAVDDMSRAFQQAKKAGRSAKDLHTMKDEIDRLKKLKASAEADSEKKKRELEGERAAEVTRMQGAQLQPKQQEKTKPSVEYLAETDFSHWTRQQVSVAVKGITHKAKNGAKIEVTEMQENSKIQASVTTKKGNRALYYEMDLHLLWKGKASPMLKPADGSDEMQGLFRLYNVAHDTKFELGGDENTSYMYQLGWDQRLSGPWVEDLRSEAAELFDLVALKVDGVIRELRKK